MPAILSAGARCGRRSRRAHSRSRSWVAAGWPPSQPLARWSGASPWRVIGLTATAWLAPLLVVIGWRRSGHHRCRGSDDAPALGPRRGPLAGLRTPGRPRDVRPRGRVGRSCRSSWRGRSRRRGHAVAGVLPVAVLLTWRHLPRLDRRSVVPIREIALLRQTRPVPPAARTAARGRGSPGTPG